MSLVTVTLTEPAPLSAQAHAHGAKASTRDARLDLLLGGPHVVLYHRGYLALGDQQIAGLLQLQRSVCEAEFEYVRQTESWRDGLGEVLSDSALLLPRQLQQSRQSQQSQQSQQSPDASTPSRLRDFIEGLALAESKWLTELLHARRDALALLTSVQRDQLSALRDHWARETISMIEQATRPGQRGHPGTQLPIRVPGMVVHQTTLLPHCEALHGPSRHIVVPPPR